MSAPLSMPLPDSQGRETAALRWTTTKGIGATLWGHLPTCRRWDALLCPVAPAQLPLLCRVASVVCRLHSGEFFNYLSRLCVVRPVVQFPAAPL